MNCLAQCLFLLTEREISKDELIRILNQAAEKSGALLRDDIQDPFLRALEKRLDRLPARPEGGDVQAMSYEELVVLSRDYPLGFRRAWDEISRRNRATEEAKELAVHMRITAIELRLAALELR